MADPIVSTICCGVIMCTGFFCCVCADNVQEPWHCKTEIESSEDDHVNRHVSRRGYRKRRLIGQGGYHKLNELETALFLSENRECAICIDHEPMNDFISIVQCGHIFHKRCLNSWITKTEENKRTGTKNALSVCPLCELPIVFIS